MLNELVFGVNIVEIVGNPFYLLLVWIGFDIITGLLRAGKDRVLNSSVNFDGLIRKLGEIVGLMFLTFVDSYFKLDGIIIKSGVWLLIIYETLSIIENLKQIGVDLTFIMKYFDKDKYKDGYKAGDKYDKDYD